MTLVLTSDGVLSEQYTPLIFYPTINNKIHNDCYFIQILNQKKYIFDYIDIIKPTLSQRGFKILKFYVIYLNFQ